MHPRTHEGHMDWEPQNPLRIDQSSPFAQLPLQQPRGSFACLSESIKPETNPNTKPSIKRCPPPPQSIFSPQLQFKPSAPLFRNPAFTTPQKRVHELASELSGAESSPAMPDISEMAETPEEDLKRWTMTPNASRALFNSTVSRGHTPGRGDIQRGSRDKVRKRRRLQGDRSAGSGRPRLSHGSDDSDSDWEKGAASPPKERKQKRPGWLSGFLATVSNHPSAPAILSKWLQLAVNMFLLGLVLFVMCFILIQIRSDLATANEQERAKIIHKMAQCSENFLKNGCSPRIGRPPALDLPCDEWEKCMTQDASAIMKVQVSVKNVAEIMNEFVGVLTLKTWGFILSLFLVAVIASNMGFGFLRDNAQPNHHTTGPAGAPSTSQPAGLHMLGSHHSSQAFIWTPIDQPHRHSQGNVVNDEISDTENGPASFKTIQAVTTPLGWRSLSKGDRGLASSKGF